MRRALWLPLLTGLGGCNILGVSCDDILVYGIKLTVVDSATGADLVGDKTVIVTDETTYADTVAFDWSSISLVLDRPGTYRIEVHTTGYAPWARDGIQVVRGGECDRVENVDVTAPLQPLESS